MENLLNAPKKFIMVSTPLYNLLFQVLTHFKWVEKLQILCYPREKLLNHVQSERKMQYDAPIFLYGLRPTTFQV